MVEEFVITDLDGEAAIAWEVKEEQAKLFGESQRRFEVCLREGAEFEQEDTDAIKVGCERFEERIGTSPWIAS